MISKDTAKNNLPQHVVVILDGNRRWAKKRGLNPWLGHRAGAKSLQEILAAVRDINLPCFSVWAMSLDNFTKRTHPEVKFLLELFRVYFLKLIKQKDLYQHQVQVNIFGAWQELFPQRVKKPMEQVIEATKKHDKRFLNFFIAYDGKDEMLRAVKKIVSKAKKDKDLKITPELIKANLWTKNMPPVDLIIRTASEKDPHLSAGFMMWDGADAQLHFTKTLWPDFSPKEFLQILSDFNTKERRFGK
jgi:undecaprenyl diphosphate synthase